MVQPMINQESNNNPVRKFFFMLFQERRVFVQVFIAALVIGLVCVVYWAKGQVALTNQGLDHDRVSVIRLGGYETSDTNINGNSYTTLFDAAFIEHKLKERFPLIRRKSTAGSGIRLREIKDDLLAQRLAKSAVQKGPYRPAGTLELISKDGSAGADLIRQVFSYVNILEAPLLKKLAQHYRDDIEFNKLKMLAISKEIKRNERVVRTYRLASSKQLHIGSGALMEHSFFADLVALRKERFKLLAENRALGYRLEHIQPASIMLSYLQPVEAMVLPIKQTLVFAVLVLFLSIILACLGAYLSALLKRQFYLYQESEHG